MATRKTEVATQVGALSQISAAGALPEPTGFEGGTALALENKEGVGALAAVAREEAEIKAAVVMAKRFPRDEGVAYRKLMRSCERPSMAESAAYSFPRGGSIVEGPSVDLAREAARCWGNIRYGLRIVSQDDDTVHIMGAAVDLETNNSVAAEDKFEKLVQRKGQGWVKPDERDLRELINRRGAILVRNCLLQILPPDVIDDAIAKAKETVRAAASGALKQDRRKTITSLVAAFSQLGVSEQMLTDKLGHDLEILTDAEVVTLRGIYKSISDGNSRRDEHFAMPTPKGAAKGEIQIGDLAAKAPQEGQKT